MRKQAATRMKKQAWAFRRQKGAPANSKFLGATANTFLAIAVNK